MKDLANRSWLNLFVELLHVCHFVCLSSLFFSILANVCWVGECREEGINERNLFSKSKELGSWALLTFCLSQFSLQILLVLICGVKKEHSKHIFISHTLYVRELQLAHGSHFGHPRFTYMFTVKWSKK